jgi:hypothetical protein
MRMRIRTTDSIVQCTARHLESSASGCKALSHHMLRTTIGWTFLLVIRHFLTSHLCLSFHRKNQDASKFLPHMLLFPWFCRTNVTYHRYRVCVYQFDDAWFFFFSFKLNVLACGFTLCEYVTFNHSEPWIRILVFHSKK